MDDNLRVYLLCVKQPLTLIQLRLLHPVGWEMSTGQNDVTSFSWEEKAYLVYSICTKNISVVRIEHVRDVYHIQIYRLFFSIYYKRLCRGTVRRCTTDELFTLNSSLTDIYW